MQWASCPRSVHSNEHARFHPCGCRPCQSGARGLVRLSIAGGFVQRGKAIEQLYGVYLYADYVPGRVWALRRTDGTNVAHREVFDGPPRVYISSFGEDAAGELYICSFDKINGRGGGKGRIYRIVEKK